MAALSCVSEQRFTVEPLGFGVGGSSSPDIVKVSVLYLGVAAGIRPLMVESAVGNRRAVTAMEQCQPLDRLVQRLRHGNCLG